MGQSNYSTGHEAEKRAAMYLRQCGYTVVEINWKTPVCEIDIIAQTRGVIHFVEVKFRKNDNQGSGFEYITSKKLQQMTYAAEVWVQQTRWRGAYQLSAIELSGVNYSVTNFLESIE